MPILARLANHSFTICTFALPQVERYLLELSSALDRTQRGCTRSDLEGLSKRLAAIGALANEAQQMGTLPAWLAAKSPAYVDGDGGRMALRDAVTEQALRLFSYGATELVLKVSRRRAAATSSSH